MKKYRQPFVPSFAFHPGETLSEKLSELNLTVGQFSSIAQQPESVIQAVIDETMPVTPNLAASFESNLGIPAQFWLNKQASYHAFHVGQV